MSEISYEGRRYEIVTFATALERIGMKDRVRDAAQFSEEMVAYAPRVVADGSGRLFSVLSGRVLYSFTVVRKDAHLPDDAWSWRTTNRTLCVVVRTENGETWLEAATPAI